MSDVPDGESPPEGSGWRDGRGPRRTWLAAERTWLAWWRTGLAVSAVALAVGKLLPEVTHGARWPSRVLGIGYGLLALCVFVFGAVRYENIAAALRRGSYEELSKGAMIALTAVSIVLVLGTLSVIIIAF